MPFRDLVKQAATVNGTGAFTLGAAVSGYQSMLGGGRAVGDAIGGYMYRHPNGQWEVGTGVIGANNTMSRTPTASSNSGALVNFPAGTGEIEEVVTATTFNDFARLSLGVEASGLPLASAPTSADFLTIIQGGTEKRVAIDTLKTYFGGAATGGTAVTGVTMTGPTGGVNGVASSNFTLGVTPVGGTVAGTVRITPASTVPGDTFAPAYRDVTTAAPTGTFTLMPSSTGARTISVTNNGGLTNPAPITYTATAAAAPSSYLRFTGSHIGSNITESGTGPYTYTGGIGNVLYCVATSSIGAQAGTDFEFVFSVDTYATRFGFGFQDTIAEPYNPDAGEMVNQIGYKFNEPNWIIVGGTVAAAIVRAGGDWVRVKRVGTLLSLEVSKNGGSSYTLAATATVAWGTVKISTFLTDPVVVTMRSATGLA